MDNRSIYHSCELDTRQTDSILSLNLLVRVEITLMLQDLLFYLCFGIQFYQKQIMHV